MEIKKVGVVGVGIMGTGIVQTCAQSGYQVVAVGVDEQRVKKRLASIESLLARRVEKGKMSQQEKDNVIANIKGSTNFNDFDECDIVIEAVNEDLDLKKKVFTQLDKIIPGHCILASNTSCLSITHMAWATRRPDKVIGMHFHNPAPVMKLMEVVKTIVTSDETIGIAKEFGQSLDKRVVIAPDVCGFVVTRLFTPFVLGAVRMLEEGIASRDDIDESCKYALNHAMGPLEVLDYIGLDTELAIDEALYEETKDAKYAPPNLLRKMVASGWLGRKSGKGFYDYSK